jgi:hypothetical protein
MTAMNENLRFKPPGVEFDPRRADDELARWGTAVSTVADGSYLVEGRRSPFNDYVRMLTPQGGVLILYKDQNRSLFLTVLRVTACVIVTVVGIGPVFSFSGTSFLTALALLLAVNALILYWKIESSHSVEIRPDAMIVDGEDVFYAQDIGDNWPELQMKDGDPERWVICGICGTRFIEYMTVNRRDENDRTAEVLAADLRAAMEQLWGRREVFFATVV